LDDFFTEKDEFGNYKRNIGAFKPSYMDAFIQYSFSAKKINIQIGVRGDFYNANQMQLKDPYLLYEAKTVKDVTNLGTHPSNMGNDYVVYVNNRNNPTGIVGYRDGENWYNAVGTQIQYPSQLETGGTINPYLVNPLQYQINSSSFENYKTVFNILPSLSINYDFLPKSQIFGSLQTFTQNPSSFSQMRPDQYFFIENQDYILNNPALKPEYIINGRIGIRQLILNSIFVELSSNYKNLINGISLKKYQDAYPVSYTTFANSSENIQFQTIELSLKYKKTGKHEINLGICYSHLVLQKDTILYDLFSKDITNSFIQYQLNKKVLSENNIIQRPIIGISVVHHFRGETYYRDYFKEHNLPIFQYFDIKIEKFFYFGKNVSTSAFLILQNVLNEKNVFDIYPNTNKPDDDGYLSDPAYQNTIHQQTNEQSFRDLYAVNMNNPNFYDAARMLIFGIRFGL
jgi:hypothetical protein